MKLLDIQTALWEIVGELTRIDSRLGAIIGHLPESRFDPKTDAPLNDAALVQGLVSSTRQDEIATAIAALKQAAMADGKADRRRRVQPKYRDPENPHNTWSGRGHMAAWLREKLEAGANMDDFLTHPS